MIKFILPLIVLLSAPFSLKAEEQISYQLSTHILDVSAGKPASGVTIKLYQQQENGAWQEIASGIILILLETKVLWEHLSGLQ